MARRDVTKNDCDTFEQLAAQLRADGFEVDHFHGVEVVEWPSGEVTNEVTHFNEVDGHFDNDRGFENNPQGWSKLVADEWHE